MQPWYDGEVRLVPGKPYKMKFIGGVYSCTCPAWCHQSLPIDKRMCKHLRAEGVTQGAGLATATTPSPAAPAQAPGNGHGAPGNGNGAAILARAAAQGRQLRPDEKAKLNGPPVLLAYAYEDEKSIDPTNWLMSEKLDGVRAYWDGKNFISRQGNIFHAPDWFKQNLPLETLDGELWMGRKQFQKTISVVKSLDSGERWKAIRYVVFDAPAQGEAFEQRLTHVQEVCNSIHNPFVQAHAHRLCKGPEDLEAELAIVEQIGGEGLMIRKPGALYEVGRSHTLLKVKPFHNAEAIVIGHKPGKGRHAGRLGGLEVQLPNGTTFTVGTGLTDRERDNPPPVGATITFRYTELTDDGVPKCSSFVAVRNYE